MEQNQSKEGCCGNESGKGGCGSCGCKAVKALALLLIGGIIGYLIGHCGGVRKMCPFAGPQTPAPMTTPAK